MAAFNPIFLPSGSLHEAVYMRDDDTIEFLMVNNMCHVDGLARFVVVTGEVEQGSNLTMKPLKNLLT